MKAFKVRHVPSGLYWKGGGIPARLCYSLKSLTEPEIETFVLKEKFSKKGKTWSQLNHVNSALKMASGDKFMVSLQNNIEIEEYVLTKN